VSLNLLSYNIRYGGTGRERQLAAGIRASDADLVIFQEATSPRVVERVAADAGMRVWAATRGYSVAFMSRVRVKKYEWLRPRGGRHPFLEVEPEGAGFSIFGLHLSAVHSNWTERRRMREMRALLSLISKRPEAPHVLVGDFNTLAPGEPLDARLLPPRLRALVWLSGGSVKYQTIQIVKGAGYVDGFRLKHPEEKGYTFPTWSPHVRLDYVFMPSPLIESLADCRVLTDNPIFKEASDHFPLLARIECPELIYMT
jgi:endonuclease/exonuclease/phosphatase family metal-dependent hydrolase